jgi:hypothetical protein
MKAHHIFFWVPLCFYLLTVGAVEAQGLSPMQKTGNTASDMKVFRLLIINPYKKEMKYELAAEDKQTHEFLSDVKFSGRKGNVSANSKKQILVFIPIHTNKRSVRVCVRFPEIEENIRPRVCGDFHVVSYKQHGR